MQTMNTESVVHSITVICPHTCHCLCGVTLPWFSWPTPCVDHYDDDGDVDDNDDDYDDDDDNDNEDDDDDYNLKTKAMTWW